MTATKLIQRRVEKVWGRLDVPRMFDAVDRERNPLGEIWFEHPDGADVELMVKYLFTSQKLSIQVHPSDAAARAMGHKRGKEEAWVVLGAEPGACIGIGLREKVSQERLEKAALDGSIEDLLDWRPAAPGDVYYLPAGTIHALGPGLTLIEIQQNADITYRLFDYGRPRELHLEQGLAASKPEPYRQDVKGRRREGGREVLAEGGAFVLERWRAACSGTLRPAKERPLWLVPVSGVGQVAGEALEPGETWLVDGVVELRLDQESELLLAYPGATVADGLIG
jgi:mannose-6-phosphate isomerase